MDMAQMSEENKLSRLHCDGKPEELRVEET